MRAIYWNGTNVPETGAAPIPDYHSNEVRIRVQSAGICGTDISILDGRHPRAQAPLILGHEIIGVVDTMGSSVSGLNTGDTVTIDPTISCGRCPACRSGARHVCSTLKLYGIDLPGGFADYIVVTADRVIPVPETVPRDIAVLAEPTAVAVHALRRSSLKIGDHVVVLGGGPIGLLIAILARHAGCRSVLISEPIESRRAIAENLGFPTVDPMHDDLDASLALHLSSVDIVFEAAGSSAALRDATRILRPRGELVQVSIPKVPREISIVDITFKELTMVGVRVYQEGDFTTALNLLGSDPETFRRLVSTPYRPSEARDAFVAARSGDGGLRVVFDFSEEA